MPVNRVTQFEGAIVQLGFSPSGRHLVVVGRWPGYVWSARVLAWPEGTVIWDQYGASPLQGFGADGMTVYLGDRQRALADGRPSDFLGVDQGLISSDGRWLVRTARASEAVDRDGWKFHLSAKDLERGRWVVDAIHDYRDGTWEPKVFLPGDRVLLVDREGDQHQVLALPEGTLTPLHCSARLADAIVLADGRTAVSPARDEAQSLEVWDLGEVSPRRSIASGGGVLIPLAATPDGSMVLARGPEAASVLAMETGRELGKIDLANELGKALCAAALPDGSGFVAGFDGGALVLWKSC